MLFGTLNNCLGLIWPLLVINSSIIFFIIHINFIIYIVYIFKYIANKNNQNLNEELSYFMCDWNGTAEECPGVYNAIQDDQVKLI